MTEKYQPIPHRLKNMAVGGHVAGAEDIDAGNGKTQQDINADTYRKGETYSKEQLNNMITTPEQEYLSVTATAETTDVDDIAALIATKYPDGKESADTVYRVGCWDGEQYDTGAYTEYVWDGTQYIPIGVKNPGIDEKPTPDSINLVESGGVFPISLAISNLERIQNIETVDDGYFNNSGNFVENSSYCINIYPVTAGNKYTFSGTFSAGSTVKFVAWLSAYDTSGSTPTFTVVSFEPYHGSATENVQYTDQPIIAPSGALYAAINLYKSRNNTEVTNIKLISNAINSRDLQSYINSIDIRTTENISVEISSVIAGKFLSTKGIETNNSNFSIYRYDVTGGENYIFSTFIPWKNGGVPAIVWLDSNNEVIYAEFASNYSSQQDLLLNKIPIQAPADAVYAAINVYVSKTNMFTFASLGDKFDFDKINKDIENKADVSSISEIIDVESDEVFNNMFFGKNGNCTSFSTLEVWKIPIEQDVKYAFSGSYPDRVTVPFIAWLDETGELVDNSFVGFLYADPYKGSMDNEVTLYRQSVTPPSQAAYAILNVYKNRRSQFGLVRTGDIIDINLLKAEVDGLAVKNMELTISGNPSSVGSSFIIRTRFDNNNDIVVVYVRHDNSNITPHSSYIGSNTLSTTSIMSSANKFHDWHDSTSPLRNGSNAPWHMFAQHGYEIPVVNCTHNLTSSDEGTVWIDQLDRNFTIGKVEAGKLYLLPEVTGPDANGLYDRAWKNHTVQDATILTLTKDGVTLTISSQTSFQIRPIQESTNFKIIADGTEITSAGVYMCNDLIISETLLCYNPFTVETWYPTPVKNTIAVELMQSFNIHGLSHRYDTILRCIEPLKFSYYGATQGQCLVSGSAATGLGSVVEGYDGYAFVPKVKTTINSNRADIPHITSSNNDDISFTRNSSTLYDIDDQPDREITYLYDSNEEKYLAGFATGVSLLRGASVKAKRNQYIASGVSGGNLSYTNRNKFYVNLIAGVHFPNNALPAGFIETFSTYFSYFNPAENKGQVYWYKDGNCYVIYAHYQDANNNLAVILPSEMDGLQVEVVEKTEGVTLLTDNIVNGKIYLTTDNTDHNYVVLKTK